MPSSPTSFQEDPPRRGRSQSRTESYSLRDLPSAIYKGTSHSKGFTSHARHSQGGSVTIHGSILNHFSRSAPPLAESPLPEPPERPANLRGGQGDEPPLSSQ